MGVLVELHRAGQEQGQPEDSSCLFVFVIILKKTKIKKSKNWIASLALFNIWSKLSQVVVLQLAGR